MNIKKHKLTLLLFLVVVLGPFLFAMVLHNKGQAQQIRLSNHGDLIKPVQSINDSNLFDLQKNQAIKGDDFKGKWWLVYVGPQHCQNAHVTHFYDMRQIRTALGKNTTRLERLFISLDGSDAQACSNSIQKEYPDMRHANMTQAEFDTLLGHVSHSLIRQAQGELYLIDPRGNIMMHYDPDMPAQDILKDIKRLLRLSKIG